MPTDSPAHRCSLPRKQFTVQEPLLALASSLCAGFGTVALFNAVGVYV